MKILLILSICFIVAGACSTMKGMERVRFKYHIVSQDEVIVIYIPTHAKLIKIAAGGEGQEYQYQYPDSSIIYLSDLAGSKTVNEYLIRKQEGAYDKRFNQDSVSFEGINEIGNYWKEVKYKGIFYGYSNVPPTKKRLFDDAISSAKSK